MFLEGNIMIKKSIIDLFYNLNLDFIFRYRVGEGFSRFFILVSSINSILIGRFFLMIWVILI